MFINNKYTNWYFSIIRNARSQDRNKGNGTYLESHHVIPRSLRGSNHKENRVLLTVKEHIICHLLLTKMCTHLDHSSKMKRAFHAMLYDKRNNRKIDVRKYINLRSGLTFSVSDEARRKISERNKHKTAWNKEISTELSTFYGRKHKETSKLLISKSLKKPKQTLFVDLYGDIEGNLRYEEYITKQKENQPKEKSSSTKKYMITHIESGEQFITTNLSSFCRNNNLRQAHMSSVANGNRRSHKGYICSKLTINP